MGWEAYYHDKKVSAERCCFRRLASQPRWWTGGSWRLNLTTINMPWEFLHACGGLDLASKEVVRIVDYLANTISLEKW